jgi:hypothetical protein
LELAEAAYMLTSVGLDRNLMHTFAYEYGYTGDWALNKGSVASLRKTLGATPYDVVIPPAFTSDELIYAKPVEWINQKLEDCRIGRQLV